MIFLEEVSPRRMDPKPISRNSSSLFRAGQEAALYCLMPRRLKSVGTNVPAQCKGHTEGREMEVMYKHGMSQVMRPSHSLLPFHTR